jgi:hypothetical protein
MVCSYACRSSAEDLDPDLVGSITFWGSSQNSE